MFTFPLLVTIYAGFTHAFEADHLLAVGNIVSGRNSLKMSLKDGIYWGLGHASTIFIIGVLMIVFKAGIPVQSFHYFEAMVGLMLIVLAVYRLAKFYRTKHVTVHVHEEGQNKHHHAHSLAYGVGLVHGLAGSGALVIVVMSQMKGTVDGLTNLLLFGAACIVGMMLAAGLFCIPFYKKIMKEQAFQTFLIMASSVLCLLYGGKVIYENLLA